jgi:hypothetical protein
MCVAGGQRVHQGVGRGDAMPGRAERREVGSAVLIDGRHLLTAAHVLRAGADEVEVVFPASGYRHHPGPRPGRGVHRRCCGPIAWRECCSRPDATGQRARPRQRRPPEGYPGSPDRREGAARPSRERGQRGPEFHNPSGVRNQQGPAEVALGLNVPMHADRRVEREHPVDPDFEAVSARGQRPSLPPRSTLTPTTAISPAGHTGS